MGRSIPLTRLATVSWLVLAQACGGGGSTEPDASSVEDAGPRPGDAGDSSGDEDGGPGPRDAGSDGGGDTSDAGVPPPDEPECRDWESRHPEWLHCDDFEGSEVTGYGDYNDDDGKLAPTRTDPFRGQHSLEQSYSAGQVGAGWLGWHFADAPNSKGIPAQPVIFARWYHKFPSAFEGFPPKMARIRRLTPSWDKQMGVHFWLAGDRGEVVADVYAPNSAQANSSGWLAVARSDFHFGDSGNLGRWVCLEMQVRMNDSGEANGAYRFWVDDSLVVERTGVDLRGNTDGVMSEVMLDTYWNGGSPEAQSRFYDNFVISTEPIGCL